MRAGENGPRSNSEFDAKEGLNSLLFLKHETDARMDLEILLFLGTPIP